MKTKSQRLWMATIVSVFSLVVLIGGCKKDDYVEIVGVCPVVVSTNPSNGATAIPLNQVVTATFNEEMNPATINQQSFTLQSGAKSGVPIPGTLTYNKTNATLSFVPSEALTKNTTYTGTVKSSVKDLNGNALQTNYVWTFSTGNILSPTVISTDPANLATAVFINKVVTASFSVPMDPLTITGTTFTLKQGTTVISGTVSYSGVIASFTPASDLLPNMEYTGTITSGAKNLAGTALENNYVWSFTTGSISGPTVISTDPTSNETGVLLNKTVTATFSMAMDPLTLTTATFIVKKGLTTITGTVSYSGKTALFNPSSPLEANTLYVCTITTGAKNSTGIPLAENYVWSFTTENSGATPTVTSTDPVNNATGVLLNKKVTATFSMAMDPLTLTTTTFIVKKGSTTIVGTVSYSGKTSLFNPSSPFEANTLYTCTITTGAKNVAGIPLSTDYVWSFTTGTITAPTVISTDPVNNATGVLLNKKVTATFNMAMNPLTITATSFVLTQGIVPVAGVVTYSGTTATFAPAVPLLPNTVYTAIVTTGVTNVAGIPLANNYVWTFTTLSTTLPTVILTDPINNATGVALNINVTASFNMPMNPLTLTSATFTVYNGIIPVTGNVTYAGTIATFNPTSDLLPATTYTATITNGAMNTGGIPLANNYVWTFTTLSTLAPTVILTNPLNNATGVALNTNVTASFNMPMNPLTLTSATFTLYNGIIQVAGAVTYAGTIATFNPTSDLLSATTYTATITTGAMNPGGIPLVSDYVWSFTTLTIVVPPTIDLGTAAAFGAFGGNAGVTNQGINTVINGGIATTAASTLVTGFHDGLTGDVYTETPLNVGLVTNGIFTAPPFPGTATSEAIATLALVDANAAYLSISPASMPGGIDPGAGELGGLTLAPGIYKAASGTFNISNGPLTLDAQGDPNATWVFQTAAGLTVGIAGPTGARSIVLINGALPKNVFWYVGSAATINGAGGGIMVGTIIATAGVTFSTPGNAVQTVLNGRALSLIASVTMVNTTINVPAP
ncbi:MAG: Ig-like domain-containing protein [Bacteroidales bacterium]|nr:Ig-like domain-containing protein [Bacteroidales bacterium]